MKVLYRFGPFELDPASRQLVREQARVRLSAPQLAVLAHLVSHAGVVISKEALIEAAWGGLAITPNSLEKAISVLRKLLDEGRTDGTTCIETLSNQGYRFTASVQQASPDPTVTALDTQLAPYRALVQGRAELDTLGRDAIPRVRRAFEDALRQAPDYAPAHIGLAMACGLAFEASNADPLPDVASLQIGIRHARIATELAPRSGEAWSALAFVLHLNELTDEAAPAAYLAVDLEPTNWRHALRAAYVTWGEERLDAAQRILALRPGLALAHWLRTTVFIARGAFDAALDELQLGCTAQDAQVKGSGFPAVGLHLLHGLVLAALDRLEEAAAALTRELSWADSGQLYARECASNTWYALGAIRLRQRKRADAEAAFTRALTIAPGHIPATAALRGEVPSRPPEAGHDGPPKGGHYGAEMATATGHAIVLARGNRHADAARIYCDALVKTSGSAGWQLPVEPLINPLAHRDVWTEALAIVRARAS
jgi:DNA-binding winged helix-turn-helix (wHTH) protein